MPGHFDDPIHGIPGAADTAFQHHYDFTADRPVDDERLTTLPAHGHQSAPIESDPANLSLLQAGSGVRLMTQDRILMHVLNSHNNKFL